MKRLLAIELQKIWQNTAAKILTITYFIIITLIIYICGTYEFQFGPFKFEGAKSGFFNFPYIWHFSTFLAASLKLFLGLVIVSMMANEYSYGTLKQNLIDGLSKKEFILSKFITIVFFALLSTLIVFLTSLVLGYTYSSYTETSIVFTRLEYLLAYFIKLVGFFSFCLFAGIFVKRSAFSLGFIFIWWFFVEKISWFILKVFVLKEKFNEITLIDTIYNYLPLESMSDLIVEPITKLDIVKAASKTVGFKFSDDYSVHSSNIIAVLIWTIIFMFLSYKIIKKRDL